MRLLTASKRLQPSQDFARLANPDLSYTIRPARFKQNSAFGNIGGQRWISTYLLRI